MPFYPITRKCRNRIPSTLSNVYCISLVCSIGKVTQLTFLKPHSISKKILGSKYYTCYHENSLWYINPDLLTYQRGAALCGKTLSQNVATVYTNSDKNMRGAAK